MDDDDDDDDDDNDDDNDDDDDVDDDDDLFQYLMTRDKTSEKKNKSVSYPFNILPYIFHSIFIQNNGAT